MERCELDSVPGDEAFARFRLKENDRLPAVMGSISEYYCFRSWVYFCCSSSGIRRAFMT